MTLLPEDARAALLQVRGHADLEFWTVGDVAALMHHECAGNRAKWLAVRNEIADLAGVTPDVVTEYKRAADYYPPAIRAHYPNLTRWHFRAAMKADDLMMSENWLNTAAVNNDSYGGQPMPVRVLMAQMNGNGATPELPSILAALDRLMARYEQAGERALDGGVRQEMIHHAFEWLRRARQSAESEGLA